MNPKLIDRAYPATTYEVAAEATQKYARAINEDNPRFFAGSDDLVAPPLFSVVYHPKALGQAIGDPELGIDFGRALHGEQDMRFHAPIRPGDVISTSARIADIREKGTGETITIDLVSHDQDGAPVETTAFTLFVRGRSAESRGEGAKERAGRDAPRPDPIARVPQQIDADQTYRYAEASGDRTKIHLEEEAARRAGLPGIIGHGLCTMGFVSKVLIDELAGTDPSRLARMALRFAHPVFPGERITTLVWEVQGGQGAGTFAFETHDPRGRLVISQGSAEIRKETP